MTLKIKCKKGTYFVKGRGLPRGCKLCLKGAKTVLFLNGICQNPLHCHWYCPISEERKNFPDTYANEIKISSREDIINEIDKTDALGMSFTGGDPLFAKNLEKTLEYLRFIKREKGSNFHVHLYTNGLAFDHGKAIKLANAGLDEIRFNPPNNNYEVIKCALNKGMDVGAEVPVIPDEDSIRNTEILMLFLDDIGANFINLNEFEYCMTNSYELKERGYQLKSGSIASVEGSRERAFDLIRRMGPKINLKINFCSIQAKDYWQLKERYKRRSKNIKKPYQDITDEGLLLYGQIEGQMKDLHKIFEILIPLLGKNAQYLNYEHNKILLPVRLALKDNVIKIVEMNDSKLFIIESTPFNQEEYRQITEKTPINIFKEELNSG
jgi:pyruvate formate-lyase activating enzyme-like uncharacterized protein